MRWNDSVRFVAGAMATYAVMAACGGGGSSSSDAGGPDGRQPVRDGQGALDALTDPVAEAHADQDTSGTRLRIQRTNGADGTTFVLGLYDSMLKVQCAFEQASDGSTRCLPIGVPSFTYFSDAACTKPVAEAPAGYKSSCGLPPFGVIVSFPPGCTNTVSYEVLKVAGWMSGTVYGKSGSSCVALTGVAPNGYFESGGVLPPSTFVQGTVTTD